MQANPMAAMAGENGHVAMHWVDGDVASSTASPARAPRHSPRKSAPRRRMLIGRPVLPRRPAQAA